MQKAMILSNQSRSMSVFWRVLIKAMQAKDLEVICCAPPGDMASDNSLKNMGCRLLHYDLERKGLNPFKDLQSLNQLTKIMKAEKPDILFATTIKPVIYGLLAAKKAGIKRAFATITGLGYAFEADTFFKKIINNISRFLYRASLRNAKGVFFQNPEDASLFRKQNILAPDGPVLFAAGTGVDTSHFAPAPFPSIQNGEITFLLIGRLLEAKGLREYAKAAKLLKTKYPDAKFQLLGPPDTGLGTIDLKEIASWQPDVTYLGETTDVRPYIARAHVIVLPSWREGLPTSLMEAMSMGRPIVATNTPGCREVVNKDVNGFLAELKNPESLAEAMEKFLTRPELVVRMGAAGRRIAEEKFDANVVAQGILEKLLQ